jgi:hypothetical protein
LDESYTVEITKLVKYVDRNEDPQVQTFRKHRHNISSAVIQTARSVKTEIQREIGQIRVKNSTAEKTKEIWGGKKMNGQLPLNVDENLVDDEQSH